MADLASVKAKENDVENAQDAPVSEALMVKKGQNVNYLIDTTDTQTSDISALTSSIASRNVATHNAAIAGPTVYGAGTTTIYTAPGNIVAAFIDATSIVGSGFGISEKLTLPLTVISGGGTHSLLKGNDSGNSTYTTDFYFSISGAALRIVIASGSVTVTGVQIRSLYSV